MGMLGSNIPDFYGQIEKAQESGARLGQSYLDSLHQGFMQQDQENQILRRNAARDAFGTAWQSGDPKAIERVMAQFPEFAKQAQEFIGIRDDQHRKDLGSLMMRVKSLAEAGDLKGANDLIANSGSTLDKPTKATFMGVIQAANNSDQKISAPALQHLKDLADGMTVSALSPQEIANEKDKERRYLLDVQKEAEMEQRDLWGHQDRIAGNQYRWAGLNERSQYHNALLNFRAQMTDKQQQIADRMNWNAWGTNNKPAIKQLSQTLQAEGRLQAALNTGTPIGDVSAMLQFMVQEAPNLSPRIAQAMGVSGEAAAGILQKAQQAIGDLQNGRKLQPQQINDLKAVSAAMKQSVQNNYYSLVSPALVGVDLSDPKQAQTAMKRTNLPLPALNYIQQHAEDYDQYGFGSGVPGAGGPDNTTAAPVSAPATTPLTPLQQPGGGGQTNPYTGQTIQGRAPSGMEKTDIKTPGNLPNGTVNQNNPDYVAYNGYWYKKGNKK
ncbi:phage DNA ejection protein [Lelliottia wanjuensis]|uniref:phage DNA ejection protein n=1 Tax=Lelliottia wanjuensis TaxID=3050585 RepID=UPI00254F2430|nr:phage DNA ejection protein [Lelliottia sp. V86_10]MDK9583169.1 phage DNA ejection protein [Lelliottia sp. V86_10]